MSYDNHDYAATEHGSVKSYLIGFGLSVILTLIPFLMVMNGSASKMSLLVIIAVTAVIQLIVQLVCFLHMGTSEDGRWNLISFIFTAIVILLLVALSIWIMWSLNANMMAG
ncbi:cytochrome o ubiquinol oxidase subunit IV [Gallibacterium anatis]|uniref:Cytochrome bo(3) ubiquinol oxidase subunit 4 n=5 Tax=Gallibacterium TaxID=155493 RepID=A0A0A2Z5A4_9PAST|nr:MULTISPECIES: cytochrome o ubiquinol oxidase subunit IV [Gallibacterium]AEC18050.1 cytochrome o ubiquinol oxidase subunit IV [Gallibacterium anatis UMN179]ERF78969.1 cytochrome O ubiquinol oxidase [Gallibacterium anatis 12656/12]KGQ30551.1 cytochrome C oxidase [Gallibacterium genomosp. 2]KGQ33409.1 cytochrome C oxidase [Gallibacterium anatis]KGQ36177.1 cytochrome C oxidase [Gallibacterium anatis]